MFIEEMTRYLARPHAATGAIALDDALLARVGELEPNARRALSLVVAAGMPIARGLLAIATELEPSEHARHIATLRDARLVRVHGGRQDDAIEPYHDRVREAVLGHLESGERRSLHAALGAVLEAHGAGPELLFHHFALAHDADRASRYAEAAAEAATRALAFDRAAALYRSALEVGGDEPERRRRLLTALGDRLTCAGRSKAAAESFLAAAGTGRVDPRERLELERRAAEQFLMGGHVAEGLAATRGVLRAFGLSLPTSRLSALAKLGWYRLRLGAHPLTWGARRDQPGLDAIARVDACWSVGAGLGMVDSVRSMLFVYQGALLALETGDEIRIARALAAGAVAEAGLGRREHAARLTSACQRAVTSDGSERARFYGSLATLATRFFLDNDWRGSIDETREAQRSWESSGRTEGWEADIVEQFACWSLDNSGRLAELRARVVPRIRSAQRAGNRFVEVNFRTQFVVLYLLRDEADEARADVEDAIASWLPGSTDFGNQDYLALRSVTYVALYSGDLRAAERLLPRWRAYFGSLMSRVVFLRQDALAFVGSIALARAAAAHAKGDALETRARIREARRAADEADALPLPMAHAYALRLRAGIHAVQGESDGARAVLFEALRDAESRGTELEAACIRWRLADLVAGDEGKRLREMAEQWMASQGARVPERLVAAILPGWRHPG
jgi:hypothetical protein